MLLTWLFKRNAIGSVVQWFTTSPSGAFGLFEELSAAGWGKLTTTPLNPLAGLEKATFLPSTK